VLRSLAWAQCRAANAQAADATDQRRVEACGTRVQHLHGEGRAGDAVAGVWRR